MTAQDIRDSTRTFIGRQVPDEIDDDQDLFASGMLNSMFALQLVVFIEKQFSIRVENEDLDLKNFNAINSITGFVLGKLEAA